MIDGALLSDMTFPQLFLRTLWHDGLVEGALRRRGPSLGQGQAMIKAALGNKGLGAMSPL